jgi:hypothetical protein
MLLGSGNTLGSRLAIAQDNQSRSPSGGQRGGGVESAPDQQSEVARQFLIRRFAAIDRAAH